jgi:uncharacterized protein YcbX
MNIQISSLNVFPIKSCAGTAVNSATATDHGFTFDRTWLIVDEHNNFLTQRELPRMALIKPRIFSRRTGKNLLDTDEIETWKAPAQIACASPDFDLAIANHPYQQFVMSLEAPDMEPYSAPFNPYGDRLNVVVWGDTCEAIDEGDEAALWLSRFLEKRCRLVRFADNSVRKVDPTYAVNENNTVNFADGFPFLLISEASLADLNSRLDNAVPMNRFRPNIVVSGCDAFAEDTWKKIRIDSVEFDLVKPCSRCVITTNDQSTGAFTDQPLRMLSTFRLQNKKIMFGQNMIASGPGSIRLATKLEILEYN